VEVEDLFAGMGARSKPLLTLDPIPYTDVGGRMTCHPPEGVLPSLVEVLLRAEPPEPGAACRLLDKCGGPDRVEALKTLLGFVNKTSKHADGPRFDSKVLDKAETALLLVCLQRSTCKLARGREWHELCDLMAVCDDDQKVSMVADLMLDPLVSFIHAANHLPPRTWRKAIDFEVACETAVEMARQSSRPGEWLLFLVRRSEEFRESVLKRAFVKENFDIAPLIKNACLALQADEKISWDEARMVRDSQDPWDEELDEPLPKAVSDALRSNDPVGALEELAKKTSSLPEGRMRYEHEAGIDRAIFLLCRERKVREDESEAIRDALQPPK
jgi:hypothetical protein